MRAPGARSAAARPAPPPCRRRPTTLPAARLSSGLPCSSSSSSSRRRPRDAGGESLGAAAPSGAGPRRPPPPANEPTAAPAPRGLAASETNAVHASSDRGAASRPDRLAPVPRRSLQRLLLFAFAIVLALFDWLPVTRGQQPGDCLTIGSSTLLSALQRDVLKTHPFDENVTKLVYGTVCSNTFVYDDSYVMIEDKPRCYQGEEDYQTAFPNGFCVVQVLDNVTNIGACVRCIGALSTSAPSTSPTPLPTASPTSQPTLSPTQSPTQAPTGSPTQEVLPTVEMSDLRINFGPNTKLLLTPPTSAPSSGPSSAGAPRSQSAPAPLGGPSQGPSAAPTIPSLPTFDELPFDIGFRCLLLRLFEDKLKNPDSLGNSDEKFFGFDTAIKFGVTFTLFESIPYLSYSPTCAPGDQCLVSFAIARIVNVVPTAQPTLFPTAFPTKAPTLQNQTYAPSASPTLSFERGATRSSGSSPMLAQATTLAPTQAPFRSPTASPTGLPTHSPQKMNMDSNLTESPSFAPTASPTTRKPTLSPSHTPTVSPTTGTPTYKAKYPLLDFLKEIFGGEEGNDPALEARLYGYDTGPWSVDISNRIMVCIYGDDDLEGCIEPSATATSTRNHMVSMDPSAFLEYQHWTYLQCPRLISVLKTSAPTSSPTIVGVNFAAAIGIPLVVASFLIAGIYVMTNKPLWWRKVFPCIPPRKLGDSDFGDRQQGIESNKLYADLETLFDDLDIDTSQLALGPVIGHGANGRIFKGLYCGTEVAVKELFPNVLDWAEHQPGNCSDNADDTKEQIWREVSNLRLLRHPNVIQLYGCSRARSQDSGQIRYLMVMELAMCSLRDVLQSHEYDDVGLPFTLEEFDTVRKLTLMKGVSAGLAYIHDCNMVHFDIKPENILLNQAGVAKICDLGIAKLNSDPNKTMNITLSAMGGTPPYMAPELLRGVAGKVGSSVDVYAYAIVLWQVFHPEQTPHPTSWTLVKLFHEVMTNNYRPAIAEDVLPEVAGLMRRCWDANNVARPSCVDITNLLERLIEQVSGVHRARFVSEDSVEVALRPGVQAFFWEHAKRRFVGSTIQRRYAEPGNQIYLFDVSLDPQDGKLDQVGESAVMVRFTEDSVMPPPFLDTAITLSHSTVDSLTLSACRPDDASISSSRNGTPLAFVANRLRSHQSSAGSVMRDPPAEPAQDELHSAPVGPGATAEADASRDSGLHHHHIPLLESLQDPAPPCPGLGLSLTIPSGEKPDSSEALDRLGIRVGDGKEDGTERKGSFAAPERKMLSGETMRIDMAVPSPSSAESGSALIAPESASSAENGRATQPVAAGAIGRHKEVENSQDWSSAASSQTLENAVTESEGKVFDGAVAPPSVASPAEVRDEVPASHDDALCEKPLASTPGSAIRDDLFAQVPSSLESPTAMRLILERRGVLDKFLQAPSLAEAALQKCVFDAIPRLAALRFQYVVQYNDPRFRTMKHTIARPENSLLGASELTLLFESELGDVAEGNGAQDDSGQEWNGVVPLSPRGSSMGNNKVSPGQRSESLSVASQPPAHRLFETDKMAMCKFADLSPSHQMNLVSVTCSGALHLPSFAIVAVKELRFTANMDLSTASVDEVLAEWEELCQLTGMDDGPEARVAKLIFPACPQLAALYGCFLDPAEQSITVLSEYMDGGSLQDVLNASLCDYGHPPPISASNGCLDLAIGPNALCNEGVLIAIARDTLEALAFLHSHNRPHGRVKPANILINAVGEVKLGDFGLCAIMEGTGVVDFSDLVYRSPEQLRQEVKNSAESDVWAFCMTLLTCAIGHHPFDLVLREAEAGEWSMDVTNVLLEEFERVCPLTIPTEVPFPAPEGYHAPYETSVRFSPEFVDFVRIGLTIGASERATVQHLIAHPWLSRSSELATAQQEPTGPEDEINLTSEIANAVVHRVIGSLESRRYLCQHKLATPSTLVVETAKLDRLAKQLGLAPDLVAESFVYNADLAGFKVGVPRGTASGQHLGTAAGNPFSTAAARGARGGSGSSRSSGRGIGENNPFNAPHSTTVSLELPDTPTPTPPATAWSTTPGGANETCVDNGDSMGLPAPPPHVAIELPALPPRPTVIPPLPAHVADRQRSQRLHPGS